MDLTLSMLDLDLSPEQVQSARTQVGAPTMRSAKSAAWGRMCLVIGCLLI